jgi:hypothetical protein
MNNYLENVLFDCQIKGQHIQEMSLPDVMSFQKQLSKAREIFSKYNISMDNFKRIGEQLKKETHELYDRGLEPEQAASELTKILVKNIQHEIRKIKEGKEKYDLSEKVVLSLLALVVVLVLQAYTLSLLSIFVSSKAAMLLCITIFGPMIEEGMKTYFIEEKMPWTGTGIFAGIEGVGFIVVAFMQGKSLVAAVIGRLIAFGFHFLTTLIQKKIIDETNQKFVAWFIGTVLHCAWNTMAVMSARSEYIAK